MHTLCAASLGKRSPPTMQDRDLFRAELSRRLRRARLRADLEIEHVEREVDVPAKTVWNWENADMPGSLPRPDDLAALCRLYRVSADWLLRPVSHTDDTTSDEGAWTWIVDDSVASAKLASVSPDDECWNLTSYLRLSEHTWPCYDRERLLEMARKVEAHLAHLQRGK